MSRVSGLVALTVVVQLAGCITYMGYTKSADRTTTGYTVAASIETAAIAGTFIGFSFEDEFASLATWHRALAAAGTIVLLDGILGLALAYLRVVEDERSDPNSVDRLMPVH